MRAWVRESWWLLVVAAFLWLALILATYTKADPGWSFSGSGGAIANRGGTVGAWLADLLLYLFGFSAWWWVVAGIVVVVAGYRRIGRPDLASEHPLGLAVLGFTLVLLCSAGIEALRLYRIPATLPLAPGGALGDLMGNGLARFVGFNGATLLLLALFAVGWSLFSGDVVAAPDGTRRHGARAGGRLAAAPRRRARGPQAGRTGAGRA
ncbi:MAG: DNA translocase FtsK 4TM domain-containing protein [Betaproteobacteria bacterium]|nr:DNA translocase FtsK 4TM domain-containing protein [Betaproteobacteria bacterium]